MPGNGKLGTRIHSWSLPAVATCPGASPACLKACYAKRGNFVWAAIRERYRRNRQRSLRGCFVARVGREIRERDIRVVRVHTAGDFYSANYIRKWRDIARRCPKTAFFAYTRSWGEAALLPELRRLAKLRNFHLWLSCDSSMTEPPEIAGARVAFLRVRDEPLPEHPVNLVFREARDTVEKRVDGVFVCPTENGVLTKKKRTCSKCQLCYTDKLVAVR